MLFFPALFMLCINNLDEIIRNIAIYESDTILH